jgi:hypothetical protein
MIMGATLGFLSRRSSEEEQKSTKVAKRYWRDGGTQGHRDFLLGGTVAVVRQIDIRMLKL